MSDLQIITTGDLSHSLYHPVLNETYHSRYGAIAESEHVFIRNGIMYVADHQSEIHVFEVGFGTGLNAMLTARAASQHHLKIIYHTIEKYPLASSIISQLNYAEIEDERPLFDAIHATAWGQNTAITPHFDLNKIYGDLTDMVYQIPESIYNIIFFDAFAPKKQPDMWTTAVFSKLYHALKPNGILVTYCSQGQFKRDLASVGFKIESLPGPPYKREMTRGVKI